MAHGRQPGTVSRILAPGPPPCPGAGLTSSGREEQQQGRVKKATQQTSRSLTGDSDDRLTPPVPAAQYSHTGRDPGPEDMEDACSEYDNVSSDVEQDYDEVLHLNARYYKQHFPEDTKHTGAEDIPESSASAAQQVPPRARHGNKTCEGSQSDVKAHKAGHRFTPHCVLIAGGEAEEGLKKVQGDRLLLRDGEESEEVLDGAKFTEELDQTEKNAPRPAGLYQTNENEKVRKESQERRNHNAPGAGRKCDPSHGGQREKERQGKGRGRRAAGGETEHPVPGLKACGTNGAEQRQKTLFKDCRKSAVRSKDRPGSSKHHHHPPPPPRHPHPHSPADPQKALPQRESPPVSGPSTANGQETQSGLMKPPLDPHQTAEEQKESPEETQRGPEKPEQVTEQSFLQI